MQLCSTPPTTTKETSTMPEKSLLTIPVTAIKKPRSTTESLNNDIDHFTTRDQMTTRVEPATNNYVSFVIVDSKLAIILSAASLVCGHMHIYACGGNALCIRGRPRSQNQ